MCMYCEIFVSGANQRAILGDARKHTRSEGVSSRQRSRAEQELHAAWYRVFGSRHLLQHTATHCNTLQHTATQCNLLQFTATHFNSLQHTDLRAAWHCVSSLRHSLQHTATRCNTLQHTASHCNSLHRNATRCNALQLTSTHCNTLKHTGACVVWYQVSGPRHFLKHNATNCTAMQNTATHCNTLHHTAMWTWIYGSRQLLQHTVLSHYYTEFERIWELLFSGFTTNLVHQV